MNVKSEAFKTAYNKLIRSVEICDVFLVRLDARRPKEPSHSLTIQLKVPKSKVTGIDDNNQFTILFRLKVIGTPDESDSAAKESFLDIDMVLEAVYSVSDNTNKVSDELLRCFAERNAPINIWPFCRELLASLTRQMGIPAVILPVRRKL